MRRSFLFFACLWSAWMIAAEVHVTVSGPESWSVQELSQYVGQTIVFDCPIVVCSNVNNNYKVAPWRMFEPENQGTPGTTAYITAMHVNSSCGFVLTGVSGYHRCGEKIVNLKVKVNSTSSMEWVSGQWQGNTRADLEAGLPNLGEYRLLVCAMNLENYFVTHLGRDYLGPDSQEEHDKQRAKVRKALAKINADIFGLVELEEGDAAIQEVVNDLNSAHPERNYCFFSAPSGGSSQKSDFVYDANVVEPIGLPSEINTELVNRKKMLAFREKSTGEKFIYSINHFKAMTGGAASETRRVNEANAVLNYYNVYRVSSSIRDKDFLVMGDLNSHGQTKPIFVFTDQGMIDMHRYFHADSSYSYMYGGKASYIDHAICNETLLPQVTGMAAYHINSDEDDRFNYERSSDASMFRCSDHDPVLVGLRLDSTLVYDPTPYINSLDIDEGTSGELIIRNAHAEGKRSFYAIYDISGVLLEQQEITSVYCEAALPASPGVYIVYIYYNGEAYQKKLIVR